MHVDKWIPDKRYAFSGMTHEITVHQYIYIKENKMTITTISTIDAKEAFADLLNRVAHNKERIILTRRDKNIAAIIPIEDLALLQDSQNKHDLHDAVEALREARENGTVTLEELKDDIG
jgi:prevent-host-death family protein